MPNLPLHPMAIHFPIAILLFSVLMDILGAATRRPSLKMAGAYSLIAGLIAGTTAILTGFLSANAVKEERAALLNELLNTGTAGAAAPPFLDELLQVLESHMMMALIALGIFGVLLIWRIIYWERLRGVSLSVYLLGALVASLLLVRAGFLGGQMGHVLLPEMSALKQTVNQTAQETATNP